MAQWIFINDDFVPEEKASISIRDLAIMRGYGVFDFFKVQNTSPVFLNDHLERFFFSASEMRLKIIYSKEELKTIIQNFIQKNTIVDAGIRITLTGGVSKDAYSIEKPNLIISAHSFTAPTEEEFEKGIQLITYPHQRQLPHVKTIDYLMAIWLQPLLQQKQANDILYYQNGWVSECPRSNFFIVTQDETIITPTHHILKGITRKKLLEAAKNSFKTEERDIKLTELISAKEAFVSSTTKTILPVNRIDSILFKENAVAKKLKELFKNMH